MKVEKSFTINAPADKVLEVITSKKLIEEDEKARQALSVEVKDVKKTDAEHVYEVHTETYARGMTGIDKSKTENNVVTAQWNLKSRTCHWEWKGGGDYSDKVTVLGTNTIVEKGGATSLVLTVDIEVAVPIVGKKISKKVGEAFQANWPKYVARLESMAKAL